MKLVKSMLNNADTAYKKTLLPYEYEFTCISCGNNVIKQKHEPTEMQQKKINFINRLKNDEHKFFFICIEVYKIYEGDKYNKIHEALSNLTNKNLKSINALIEK